MKMNAHVKIISTIIPYKEIDWETIQIHFHLLHRPISSIHYHPFSINYTLNYNHVKTMTASVGSVFLQQQWQQFLPTKHHRHKSERQMMYLMID